MNSLRYYIDLLNEAKPEILKALRKEKINEELVRLKYI
jgi:hypothetical protein